jgi:hypothetical protein
LKFLTTISLPLNTYFESTKFENILLYQIIKPFAGKEPVVSNLNSCSVHTHGSLTTYIASHLFTVHNMMVVFANKHRAMRIYNHLTKVDSSHQHRGLSAKE